MAKRRYEMDMCRGPLVGKILRFSLPLMLSGILQLLFNAADLAVVGQYSGDTALAAVGSTSALTNLLVNLTSVSPSVPTSLLRGFTARATTNRSAKPFTRPSRWP